MVSTLLHRMQADCPFARMHAVAHTLRLSHTQFLTSIEPQLHQFSNTPCFRVAGTPYTPCPRELAYTLVQQKTHRTIDTKYYFAAKQIRARPCSPQSQHARHPTHPKHHVRPLTLAPHVLCHLTKMRASPRSRNTISAAACTPRSTCDNCVFYSVDMYFHSTI